MAGSYSSAFSTAYDVFVAAATGGTLNTYSFVVEDENDQVVAVLENIMSPEYSRTKNGADQMSLSLPRNDVKFSELKIGRRIEIQRNGLYEASGYITERGYDGNEISISALTDEILFERWRVPTNFGYPLYSQYNRLNTFCANMLKRYSSIHLKYRSQYESRLLNSVNIDFTANPEVVYLAKEVGDDYYTTGYFEVRFRDTDFDNWSNWDRIRWVADYADNVQVAIQYRTGSSDADANGKPWVPSTGDPAGEPGALPDIVGLVPANTSDPVLDVRVNFKTSNVALSANLFALEVIAREPSGIVQGSFDVAASNVVIPGIEADGSTALEVMVDVFEQVGWDFRVRDGILDIAETFGQDKTNEFTLIAG